MNPLISVIVPIYGIDRYIGLCIESIINQTYKNIEIILVDDGSPDRCADLCDLYAKKDRRIKVIHKKNSGLVSARQAGLRESNGVYISNIDGDDWVEPDFIESLYSVAVKQGTDVVCAGFTRDLFKKLAELGNAINPGCYEGEELKSLWQNMISYGGFYRPGITTYIWNKLFKREVILEPQSTVDTRISIGEDAAVTYPALLKSKKVAVTVNTSYHYRQREDSMLKQSTEYANEAQKLKYLNDYLMRWAGKLDPELRVTAQVEDYILANAIMRSGGKLPQDKFSTFDSSYYGKDVVIYNAGTFGQQLVNRFRKTKHCNVIAWIDDDFWEYRRCCLDVDSVESVIDLSYDYILIAKVDEHDTDDAVNRLIALGVDLKKILTIKVPDNKGQLIKQFLDVDALKTVGTLAGSVK